MSNTRVFDYTEISNIYNSMNQIIGDNSDPSSIAGLLHKIDNDYHEVVNGTAGEDALAIYGDLGAQLLLNWENTAGSFPAFVENFSTWSTVVAQAAGDYANFEQQVKGIRSNNPLGWNSGGIQTGFVASSAYNQSFTDEELDEYAAGVQMYQQVGAYYVDTGMVSYAKKNAFWNGFGDVLSVVSIVASGCSLVKGLGLVGGAAGTAGGVAGTADDATRIMVDGTGDIAGTGLRTAGQSVDDLIAGGKPIANSALYGLGDDTAAAATDKLIKSGYTLVDDTWQLPASAMGAPTAANSAFNTMTNSVDDLIAGGKPIANSALYGLDDTAAAATDKLIKSGYTLVDDTWQLPASAMGAPTAANSAFNVAGNVDELMAAGKPIANSALYGLGDDTAAAATDKLIKSGYTLVDDTWQLPASSMGAPTAANSAFNSMAYTADDLIATGKPIANSSLYSLGDEGASLATDKLIANGYTLVDDTWQLPASASGAPSLSSGSAFGKIVDDTPVNYIDEAINSGKTMGADGFTTPAKFRGAPSSPQTSALAGDLSKTVSKDSIGVIDKGLYYGREGLHQVGTTVKNGLSTAGTTVKNGLSTAGTAVKNGLSTAGAGLKTAGTWVYENGVPVLKDTVTNLGTSGVIGQVANVGQNAVDSYQVNRTAEMIARANEHFGNNGN